MRTADARSGRRSGRWIRESDRIIVLLGSGAAPEAARALPAKTSAQGWSGEIEYSIAADRAADKNRTLMNSLGWAEHYQRIARELLGFKSLSPDETTFATAVAEWQKRMAFSTVDGIVGPVTWSEMQHLLGLAPKLSPKPPIPEVNSLMPRAGAGFCCHKPQSRRYGLPETILALVQVGMLWLLAHPRGPRVRISDISQRGGGKLSPHVSHRVGLDVDIWLMRNDGKEQVVNFRTQRSVYSQSLTQELVDTIRSNGVLPVKCIFFEDKGVRGVRGDGRHFNHVHVRFCMPARLKTTLKVKDAYKDRSPATYECPPNKC